MNNVFAFSNAEEFKELFGMRTMANGEKVRKNKILLGFLKDFNFHKYVRSNYPRTAKELFRIKDVADLYTTLNKLVATTSGGQWYMSLLGYGFRSEEYRLDNRHGVCQDHDFSKVRVVYNDGSVKKIKAGKLYRSLIMSSEFGSNLPESTVLYLCEEFTRRWEVWAETHVPKEDILCESFELHVDDDFAAIYDTDKCIAPFSYSCMFDGGQHVFYENAVDAKAAYLLDKDGMIVARCVIFTDVHEEGSDRIWRMAERQYAIRLDGEGDAGNEHMKRIFVDKLIKAGYIDCYKKIGAACSEATAILDTDGNSLSDKTFYIPCHLRDGDTISFQDTFKYYDPEEEVAYNRHPDCPTVGLDTTSERVSIPWDDYHNCYCANTVAAHYQGSWIRVSSENLDDFVEVNDEYYHYTEVMECPHCGGYFVDDSGCYSELLEEDFCCEDCMNEAEKEYAEENGLVWDSIDYRWIPKEESVVVARLIPRIWLSGNSIEMETTSAEHMADSFATGDYDRIGDRIFLRHDTRTGLEPKDWPKNEELGNLVHNLWNGDTSFEVVRNGEVIAVNHGVPTCAEIFGADLW